MDLGIYGQEHKVSSSHGTLGFHAALCALKLEGNE